MTRVTGAIARCWPDGADSRGADANAIRKAGLVDPGILEAARSFVRGDRDALDANTLLKQARAVLEDEAAKTKLRKGR